MKKNKEDRKLIRTQQRRVSAPYADANPSKVTDVYWIFAERKKASTQNLRIVGSGLFSYLFQILMRCGRK